MALALFGVFGAFTYTFVRGTQAIERLRSPTPHDLSPYVHTGIMWAVQAIIAGIFGLALWIVCRVQLKRIHARPPTDSDADWHS